MSRGAAVEALLFDLGNVLIDVDFGRAISEWATGANAAEERIAACFVPDDAYCAHERGELSEAQYFASLRKSLGIDLTNEQFLSGWNAIFGEPIEGMERLVGALARDFPVYVFSNTNKAHRMHWEPRYRALLAPVRQVICSCDIGVRKPDAIAFAKVAKLMGVAPSRIGFFDDLEENVAGGRAAGLQAFRVTCAADVRKALLQLGVKLNGNF
jgi:HAD superfamily hydrolase (TIGR01509 family)